MRWIATIITFLLICGCSTKRTAPNKFSDPVLTRIYDLKDRRSSDSLLFYLKSENPVYRRAAAFAFASVQDSLTSIDLGNMLLEDPDNESRENAAFALGQTGGIQAVNALIPALQNTHRGVVREVLEALGKTIAPKDLSTLTTFQTRDTLLQEGLVWAFYRLALRSKADSTITKQAAGFLSPSFSFLTRFGAASYFGRSSKLPGSRFENELVNAAQYDTRPEVRMMAVAGFKHLAQGKALPVLKEIIHSDKDYRVRISAVRVCQNFPLTGTDDIVFDGLVDSVEMVQVAASEVIRNISAWFPLERISDALPKSISWRVKSNLYGALLKYDPDDRTMTEFFELYKSAPTYFRSALLSAAGEARSPLNKKTFLFISKELNQDSNEKVILSSAAAALVSLDRKSKNSISRSEFLAIYKQAIKKGDPAVVGTICSALTDTALRYKNEIKDLEFLYQAKAKLVLPKDIESLEPLDRAIAYLEGKEKPEPLKNNYNHPIDWAFVKTIPAGQRIEITTSKGPIVLRLFVEETPGSVSNFVALINAKYFDGKFFHRVVPNFVIQTGCNRGDGFGSEDYSIRSEFSRRRYQTGSVGMASAGKDTEGTQWFITHSPTPHLDGRYTLFAKVESGMESVDKMEVGDKILEMKLAK